MIGHRKKQKQFRVQDPPICGVHDVLSKIDACVNWSVHLSI